MKNVYEAPQFSVSVCRVQDDFLASAVTPTTPSTTIAYDPTEGWGPIKPPRT